MDQIQAALTNRIGPFPGYVWAGVVVLGAFVLLRGRSLLGSPTASRAAATVTPQGNVAPSAIQGPPGPPGPAGAPPPASKVPAPFQGMSGQQLYQIVATRSWDQIGSQYGKANAQWLSNWYHGSATGGDGAGVGGPVARRVSIGSRRSWLMSPHHPDLKRSVRVTQTIRAGGGEGGHTAAVHATAASTGLHPARLLALNPHYSGVIRVH